MINKFKIGDHVEVVKNIDNPEFDYMVGTKGFVSHIVPYLDRIDYMFEEFNDLYFHEVELRKVDPAPDVLESGKEKSNVFQPEVVEV